MPASTAGSYNSLAFGGVPGGAAQVKVLEMVGIRDLPALESTHQPKKFGTGMFRGTVRKRGLTFKFTFGLIPNTRTAAGFDALLETVLTAFEVQETADLPLRFWGNTLYVNCHPVSRTVEIECEAPQTAGEVTVEFFACDPTIYTGAP
jgi:hypothetical protein